MISGGKFDDQKQGWRCDKGAMNESKEKDKDGKKGGERRWVRKRG